MCLNCGFWVGVYFVAQECCDRSKAKSKMSGEQKENFNESDHQSDNDLGGVSGMTKEGVDVRGVMCFMRGIILGTFPCPYSFSSTVLESISQVIQFDPIVRSPNNRVLVKYLMAPPHGLLQCSATHKEALLNTFLFESATINLWDSAGKLPRWEG